METTNNANLDLFIQNYSKRDNLKIILCEGIYNEELSDYSNIIYKHLKFKLNNILWVKENLINLAIKHLPNEAEYIAWSDRDIYFLNPSWVEETIEKLKVYDIVQPWSEIIHLNSNNELQMIARKDGMLCMSNKSVMYNAINFNNRNKFGASTGQIWAINKLFYNKIEKINDIEIIGGADSMISNFCILKDETYENVFNKKITTSSKNKWLSYQKKFEGVKFNYVNGLIIHYWHGSMENRQYNERHNILINENYNPDNDIEYDNYGVLKFTQHGKRLEPLIKEYFYSRKENEQKIENENNHIFSISYRLQTCLVPKIIKNNED